MKYPAQSNNPFEQEVPYGTRRVIDGVECVYMPDPWTFPEGFGNAWCSVPELIKSGIKPREIPMTKIVYNDCYGGFDLSTEGTRYYAQLAGIQAKVESQGVFEQVIVGDTYFQAWMLSRTDPYLVKTVEDLGPKADGPYARLRIREVPAGSRYRIDEYDGLETVMLVDEYEWRLA
jgi:hypothetical protein